MRKKGQEVKMDRQVGQVMSFEVMLVSFALYSGDNGNQGRCEAKNRQKSKLHFRKGWDMHDLRQENS